MTSLAQIREQLRNRKQSEPELLEATGETGFTSDFDPTGRGKYVTLMQAIAYSELPEYQKAVESDPTLGYFCKTCEYMIQNQFSPTSYWCSEYQFPDKPVGCCAGWSRKEDKK